MGRQIYVYQGQEYSLPDTLGPDEALTKIKGHLGQTEESKQPTGNLITGALETGANILSSIPATIAGGVAGLGSLTASGGDLNKANDTLNSVSKSLTYEPKTDTGKNYVNKVGEVFHKGEQILGNAAPNVVAAIPFVGEQLYKNLEADPNEMDLVKGLGGSIAMNFLPLDMVHGAIKAGKVSKVAKPVIDSPRLSELDKIDATDTMNQSSGSLGGEHAAPIDMEYLAKRRAEEAATSFDIPKPEDLEAKNTNAAFLEEAAARRAELEQAKQGPQISPEELQRRDVASKNQEFLDEFNKRVEETGRSQSKADEVVRQEQAQQAINQRQADLERQVRDAKTQEQVQQIMARQEVERQQLQEQSDALRAQKEATQGVNIGSKPVEGGRAINRPPVTDSGLMGVKPASAPFKALTNPGEAVKDPNRKALPTPSPNNPWGSISGIPRNQRGGINFDEVSKALGNAKSVLGNIYGKIPGHAELAEAFGQKYPDMEKLKSYIIKAATNSKQYFNKLQSGSSLSYIQTRDPLIRGVSSIMQAAAKRVDGSLQRFVQPVEASLQALRKTDPRAFMDLGEVFKREMLQRKVYTPEQLAQAGFSPDHIKLYQDIRGLYDKTYEIQNKVLEKQGRPPLSKLEYYMASRWKGDWGTSVYGKDGKLLWVIRGDSKAEVKAGLDHLEKSGIEFDKDKSTVEFTKKDPGKFADYPAAYAAMVQHLSEHNPMTEAARKAMESMDAQQVFKMLGQNKHFMEKANIRGFVGDRPWVSKFDDINDMFHQQMQYAKNGFEWAEMQQAGKMADTLLEDPTIAKQSPDSVKYARDVVDRYTGRGDHQLFAKVEQTLAKSFGRSTSEFRNATSALKSFWILRHMATNISNVAFQNPIQFINSLSHHRDLTTLGVEHNAIKTFAFSAADTLAGLSQHYGAALGIDKGMKAVTKIGQDAINYARANGILERSVFDEHTDLNTPEWQKKYNKTLGWLQIESDKLSRFAAFMGYVHHLDQSGKFPDKMDLFREAEHYTRGSMVDTSMKERPFMVQDTGNVGMLGSALQSFSANYLNQFAGFARKAAEGIKNGKPNDATPLAVFMATSAALTGLGGMTGFNWFGDLYDYIRDNSPEAYTSLPDFRKFLYQLEDDGSFFGTVASRGVPAALSGANLGPSFDASLQVPLYGMAKDLGGMVADTTSNLASGNFAKAAYALAPTGMAKGLIETDSGAFQDKKTGKYSNTKGDFEKGFDRSDKDKLYKRLGLTSIAEARKKDRIYFSSRDNQSSQQATQYFTNMAVKSLFDKGEVNQRAIEKLSSFNPEALNNLGNAIQKEGLARGMNDQAIAAMKMKSLPQIQRYVDYANK